MISLTAEEKFEKIINWDFKDSKERKQFLSELSKEISVVHTVRGEKYLFDLKEFNVDSLPIRDIVKLYLLTTDFSTISQYLKNIIRLRLQVTPLQDININTNDDTIYLRFDEKRWKLSITQKGKTAVYWESFDYPFYPDQFMLPYKLFSKNDIYTYVAYNIAYSNISLAGFHQSVSLLIDRPISLYALLSKILPKSFVDYKNKILIKDEQIVKLDDTNQVDAISSLLYWKIFDSGRMIKEE